VSVVTLSVQDPALLPWAEQIAGALSHGSPLWEVSAVRGPGDLTMEVVLGSEGPTPNQEVLAVLKRGDPRDALLVSEPLLRERAAALAADPMSIDPADPLRAVPPGATVTLCGALRQAQVTRARPDVVVRAVPGEGDVLDAWISGQAEVAVVSAAALDRAGLEEHAARRLDDPWIGPIGAGALWIWGPWRADLRELLLPLDDRATRVEVLAERSLSDALRPVDGVVVGANARVSQSRLDLRALLVDPERGLALAGKRTGEATMRGATRLAAMLGRELGERAAGTLTVAP